MELAQFLQFRYKFLFLKLILPGPKAKSSKHCLCTSGAFNICIYGIFQEYENWGNPKSRCRPYDMICVLTSN